MSSSTVFANYQPFVGPPNTANWYAVATKSRHERIVAHQLRTHGITTFVPSLREVHRWSDRSKTLEVPLFAGYVFLHASLSAEVRKFVSFARGTAGFISMQGSPVAIPSKEIDAIQRILSHQVNCAAYAYLKVGERVRIRGGALDGIEGILVQSNGHNGLVVSINGISRSVLVRIHGYSVEAI